VNRVLEAKGPPGTWGNLVETGLPGATAQVRWIADDAFGGAPLVLPPGPNDEHLVAASSRYHISTDAAAPQGRALPLLRFKGRGQQVRSVQPSKQHSTQRVTQEEKARTKGRA
jgi:hypothetical protein